MMVELNANEKIQDCQVDTEALVGGRIHRLNLANVCVTRKIQATR